MFEEFKDKGKEIWLQKLEKDLKGKSVESLDWKIDEDLAISAFLSREDKGAESIEISPSQEWKHSSSYSLSDSGISNKLLLEDLEGGIEHIQIQIRANEDLGLLENLLDQVILDYISLDFNLADHSIAEDLAKLIKSICAQQNMAPKTLRIGMNLKMEKIDFIKSFLLVFPQTQLKVYPNQAVAMSERYAEQINRGLRIVEELAEDKTHLDILLSQIVWVYDSTDIFFVNVAAIRALKILWTNVLSSYDLSNTVFVESQIAVLSEERDLYTNMIHASSQALSSVCASCDRLLIITPDIISGQEPTFTRRIARNIHHILKMESYLERVQDPGKGAYSIEVLTKEIADINWKHFLLLPENQKAGI